MSRAHTTESQAVDPHERSRVGEWRPDRAFVCEASAELPESLESRARIACVGEHASESSRDFSSGVIISATAFATLDSRRPDELECPAGHLSAAHKRAAWAHDDGLALSSTSPNNLKYPILTSVRFSSLLFEFRLASSTSFFFLLSSILLPPLSSSFFSMSAAAAGPSTAAAMVSVAAVAVGVVAANMVQPEKGDELAALTSVRREHRRRHERDSSRDCCSCMRALFVCCGCCCGCFCVLSLPVIDYTINKTSNAVTALDYSLRDSAEGNPRRDFLRSSLRGLSKFVDENALALEWKVRVLDFDDKSPVSSQWIVRGVVGLVAFWITRRTVMAAAMR